MTSSDDSQPLLLPSAYVPASGPGRTRRRVRAMLSSRPKHFVVIALVGVDVMCVLADVLTTLMECEAGVHGGEPLHAGLETAGLVFSSLFLVELLLSVWAFGLAFFANWFHCVDTLVIVASFLIDVLSRGVLAEIGSLVILLRLWRFVKIVEELGMGASERQDELNVQLEAVQRENGALRRQLNLLQGQGLT